MALSNAAFREKFRAFKRSAWKPVTEPGPAGLLDSKYAGIPWLGMQESYPVCGTCKEPLQLFLQLNIAQLPAEAKNLLGFEEGLLQLFYCTQKSCESQSEGEPFSNNHLIRIVPGTTLLHSAPESAQPGIASLPEKKIVGWTAFDDFPSMDEEIELPELSEDDEDAYYLSEPYLTASGDKLGGWPAWVQEQEYPECPECRELMQLVYQIDSYAELKWSFGDIGTGHITQCAEHRHVLAFGWSS